METQKVTFTVSLKGGVCFNMRTATAWNYMELRTKELNISTEKACFLKKKQNQKKKILVNKDARVKQSTKAGQSMEWYLLW